VTYIIKGQRDCLTSTDVCPRKSSCRTGNTCNFYGNRKSGSRFSWASARRL